MNVYPDGSWALGESPPRPTTAPDKRVWQQIKRGLARVQVTQLPPEVALAVARLYDQAQYALAWEPRIGRRAP